MFCPKCGNEISKDMKFCPKCGWQILREPVVENIQENKVPQKVESGKIILITVIAIAVILVAILIANKIKSRSDYETVSRVNTEGVETNRADDPKMDTSKEERGFSSYEDVIDALFTAAYDKDVEAVINCFPEEMESYAKKLYNVHRSTINGSWSEDVLNYMTSGFFAFEMLNLDNKYWYEIVDKTELEQSCLWGMASLFTRDRLQEEYGLTFEEAYVVEVKSMGEYDTEEFGKIALGVNSFFEVAKIGERWYVLRLDSNPWRDDWMDW